MRDQNPVVHGKNFKDVAELILTKKNLNERAQKDKYLNEVVSSFCIFEIKVNMVSSFTSFIKKKFENSME
jgi:hypothetical protein